MRKLIAFIGIVLLLSACGNSKKTSKTKPSKGRTVSPELVYKRAFHKAMQLKITGRYPEAKAAFEECLLLNSKDDGVYFALSELNAFKNDIPTAIEHAEKALDLKENNKWYALNLALLYQKSGAFDKAAEAYEKALKEDDSNVNIWFAYSDALLYNKDYEKAIEAYDKIEDKMGVIPEISVRKYQMYAELGKMDKAEEEVQKLINSNPKDPQFYGILSELYLSQRQFGKAKAVLDKMIELDPDNGATHLSLADYYAQQNDLDGVKKHLLEAFKSEDLDLENKMRIILGNFDRIGKPGDLGKDFAYELLDALVLTHPDEAKVYAVYADYDQEYKNIQGARDMYLRSIREDNSKFPIWNQMLLLSANLNEYDTVYHRGKEAIELFPTQPILYLLTGLGAIEKGNGEEAIELLSTGKNYILNERLMEGEFNFQIANAHFIEKNYDEAFKHYEKALAIDSTNPLYLNNYAYKLAQRKTNLLRAETLIKRAIDIVPDQANYEDTYGWVLFQMNKFEAARKWIFQAMDHSPRNPDLNEHYGDVLFKLNDIEGAKNYWKKAKELGGNSKLLLKKIETGQYHE